jgi:hypothetical protein
MSTLGNNEFLPLPTLSGKLVTLLALATLLRVSELASVTFASVILAENAVKFSLSKPRKAQRSGPLQTVTLPAFPDSNTCPVKALQSYVNRTSVNRPPSQEGMLFISLIAPFRAVTGNTIGRWINFFLRTAGINTEIYSAHSTQSAASSLAVARGLSVDQILQTGNWASESTFNRFYNREKTATFAASVMTDA